MGGGGRGGVRSFPRQFPSWSPGNRFKALGIGGGGRGLPLCVVDDTGMDFQLNSECPGDAAVPVRQE